MLLVEAPTRFGNLQIYRNFQRPIQTDFANYFQSLHISFYTSFKKQVCSTWILLIEQSGQKYFLGPFLQNSEYSYEIHAKKSISTKI